ncbi:MAG: hypothetical protein ACI9H8_001485 [Lysobacterales bacterium]|jgi:hypothetical protein
MNILLNTFSIHQDPLGLQGLPLIKPDQDNWPGIRQALEENQVSLKRRNIGLTWLAVAASLVITVLIVGRQMDVEGPEAIQSNSPLLTNSSATLEPEPVSLDAMDNVDSLISLSQTLETQLRNLRDNTGSMPANSAVFVAELEDLVAQVDNELSYSPNSVNLWGQRVNLLLDLAQIYQHHWETEYGQMASL